MWHDQRPRKDTHGRRWNFRIWADTWTDAKTKNVVMAERLFFWNDTKSQCGLVLFPVGSAVHFSRLKQMEERLVSDSALRKHYQRELRFPLERHYSQYGVFPEEKPN